MKIQTLCSDDSAVSPVIGVILMVAITVILAAVIAAFVFGLADSSESAPQVSFNYDYDEDAQDLRVTTISGDRFTASQVTFEGVDFTEVGETWADVAGSPTTGDSRIGAGGSVTLDAQPTFDLDIVWRSADGESSTILGSRSGPDA